MRRYVPVIAIALCVLVSCDLLGDGLSGLKQDQKGTITLKFAGLSKSSASNSTVCYPDTNSFLLSVLSESGESLYEGKYGHSPDRMQVSPGRYFIRAVSFEFNEPRFDCPQWGDSQTVSVAAGQSLVVELLCRQMNCGIRLVTDESFKAAFPDGTFLISSDDGELEYSYNENRIAYYNAGQVRVLLSQPQSEEQLLSRSLNAGEILSLSLKAKDRDAQDQSRINVSVDTSRTYVDDFFTYGEDDDSSRGDSPEHAFPIAQAKEHVGDKGVWVGGYIVGGDLTSKSVRLEAPFASASNLALGPRAQTLFRDSCLSVQLSAGPIREALNLVANPGMLGNYVYLKGDIVSSYFGLVGLKNLSDYKIADVQ